MRLVHNSENEGKARSHYHVAESELQPSLARDERHWPQRVCLKEVSITN